METLRYLRRHGPLDSRTIRGLSITPHIAGLSAYYNDRIADLFSENLRRYLNGEPLLNLVQRERDY